MQPYHCDDMHEDDLVVVVLVVARSSDFDQPHPHNGPIEASTVGTAAPEV